MIINQMLYNIKLIRQDSEMMITLTYKVNQAR